MILNPSFHHSPRFPDNKSIHPAWGLASPQGCHHHLPWLRWGPSSYGILSLQHRPRATVEGEQGWRGGNTAGLSTTEGIDHFLFNSILFILEVVFVSSFYYFLNTWNSYFIFYHIISIYEAFIHLFPHMFYGFWLWDGHVLWNFICVSSWSWNEGWFLQRGFAFVSVGFLRSLLVWVHFKFSTWNLFEYLSVWI